MSTESPDQELLAACARFAELGEQIEQHNGEDLHADNTFDKLIADQGVVVRELEGLTPLTPEGRMARARVAYEVLRNAGSDSQLPLEVLREAAGLEPPGLLTDMMSIPRG